MDNDRLIIIKPICDEPAASQRLDGLLEQAFSQINSGGAGMPADLITTAAAFESAVEPEKEVTVNE